MDRENVKYLNDLAARANYYTQVRRNTIEYITKRKIEDKPLTVSLLLMSALWAANKRQEDIDEDDLTIYFGLHKRDQDDEAGAVVRLNPQYQGMSLQQVLDITVQSHVE